MGSVLVRVANNLFPALRLEEWTITLVVALLVPGVPLAISLAWVFDVTAEGIRRTPPSTAVSSDSPRATEERSSAEVDAPSRGFDGSSREGDRSRGADRPVPRGCGHS